MMDGLPEKPKHGAGNKLMAICISSLLLTISMKHGSS
jgi:hypothetical protein